MGGLVARETRVLGLLVLCASVIDKMTLRCVKCTLRIDRLKRHSLAEESEEILEIVRNWIYPRELLGGEYLCHACWVLSQTGEPKSSSLGHRNICATCGKSILRVKSRVVLRTEATESELVVVRSITDWIQPRALQHFDRVCIPCWLKAKRVAESPQLQHLKAGPAIQPTTSNDSQQFEKLYPINDLITNHDTFKHVDVKVEPLSQPDTNEIPFDGCWTQEPQNQSIDELAGSPKDEIKQLISSSTPWDQSQNQPTIHNSSKEQIEILFLPEPPNEPTTNNDMQIEVKIEPNTTDETEDNSTQESPSPTTHKKAPKKNVDPQITLPALRRGAATGRRCLFVECNQRDKRHVPFLIRRRILADYNFYIPTKARMCEFHLKSHLFHELYTARNAMATFTAEQVEDMVSLLQKDNEFDLKQPEEVDDHLFEYWFGYTKSQYAEIMTQVPNLNNTKMKLGFNGLLCKIRTKDSNERISSLFKMPRRTLESYMEQAQKILLEDHVPPSLRLNLTKLGQKK